MQILQFHVCTMPMRLVVLLFISHHIAYADINSDTIFPNQSVVHSADLVIAVLSRNPKLPAMRAAWEAVQAQVRYVGRLDDPMLSYRLAPLTPFNADTDFGHKITVSQRWPWPGKLALQRDIAQNMASAERHRVEQVRLQLIEATQLAFTHWYFIHAAIVINQQNKTLLQEFKNIADIQYATGRTSKQDSLRAEVEVALLDHRGIVLTRQQGDVLAVLNTLLQRSPDLPIPSPANLSDTVKLPDIIQLRTQAITNHPDLLSLQASLKSKQSQVELAKRNLYPDLQFSAYYNSLWSQSAKRLGMSVGINIPLRDKRHAKIDQTQATLISQQFQYDAKQFEILGAVQQAYHRVNEGEHVLALYRERLLPLAEENLAVARSAYQSGSGGFLNLISVEKNLTQTQLKFAQALMDYHQYLAKLARIVGSSMSLQRKQP